MAARWLYGEPGGERDRSGSVGVRHDSATFAGATVSITGNLQPGQDVLGFANQNGISGSYN